MRSNTLSKPVCSLAFLATCGKIRGGFHKDEVTSENHSTLHNDQPTVLGERPVHKD